MLSDKAAALPILIMDADGLILLDILLSAQGLSFACAWSVSMLFVPFLTPVPAFMQLLLVPLFGFVALPIEQLF